jgi:hypothetical protein
MLANPLKPWFSDLESQSWADMGEPRDAALYHNKRGKVLNQC